MRGKPSATRHKQQEAIAHAKAQCERGTLPASPPSLLMQAMIVKYYGARLDVKQLADLLGSTAGSIRTRISAGTFEIPTYVDGGKRFADYRDVAIYVDDCRRRAKEAIASLS